MLSFLTKPFLVLMMVLTAAATTLTGCASGGFKLTRQYAGWVNKQNIIIRIILYILTSPVYVVTIVIDAVIFNTLDFWQGRVSQGDFQFKDGDKTFHVKHEIQPDSQLKKSTIKGFDLNNKLLQTVVLNETSSGEIEMFVDGQLRSKVKNIKSLPMVTFYSESGRVLDQHPVPRPEVVATR